jgi:hypothetical protein
MEIAGDEAALALYDIHDLQFVYITHVPQNRLAASQLWRVRDKFEERRASGIPFYIRSASDRTVAFAFSNDYLFLATRDGLMARTLGLLAGGKDASVGSSRWFEHAVQASPHRGELRLALNMQALLKSVYFRSHWVFRNAAELQQYESAIAVVTRDSGHIVENRVLLRARDKNTEAPTAEVRQSRAALASLAPDNAGFYRAWAAPQADFIAWMVVTKLLAPHPRALPSYRYAPEAIDTGERSGSESDLETRIDEPELPAASDGTLVMEPLRKLLESAHAQALLQVQSGVPRSNGFVANPCVLAVEAESPWELNSVRDSLTAAVQTLWTTSGLGAQWEPATGPHGIERLNGLAKLSIAVRGRRLFLANDADLLAAVLGRPSIPASETPLTYEAVFRHALERAPYQRLMTALDYGRCQQCFFSENIASLSDVLSFVDSVRVTQADRGDAVVEQVTYAVRH